MKLRLTALLLLLIAIPLHSADEVGLKDGRVLRDARVVRHDAATVTFRHSGGFTQVEKAKLPDSLLAQYPFDEAQAKLDAERHATEAMERTAEAIRAREERARLAAMTSQDFEPPEPEALEPSEETLEPIQASYYIPNHRRPHRNHGFRSGLPVQRPHHSSRQQGCAVTPPPPPPPFNTAIHMTPDLHMTPDRTNNDSTPSL